MSKRLFFLLAVAIVLPACSLYNVNSQEISANYYPSKQSIQEVSYIENVAQAHEVIGIVTVNAERRQSLDEIFEKMRREAAIMGGDAITDVQTDVSGTWKRIVPKPLENAALRANFSAKVVAFQ